MRHISLTSLANILIPTAAAAGGWLYFPFDQFKNLSGDLLVLFSILAGLLAQVMVFTGTVVTPERLSPARIERLEEVFEQQQFQWKLLFIVFLIVVAVLVIIKVIPTPPAPPPQHIDWIQRGYTAFSAWWIVHAVLRSLLVPEAVIRLQRIRFKVLREEAEMREREEAEHDCKIREQAAQAIAFRPRGVDPNHGQIRDISSLGGGKIS